MWIYQCIILFQKYYSARQKSHVEDDEIKIICIRPAISRTFSPIGRKIEFPQAKRFSERKPECIWHSCEASSSINDSRGKYDTFYYQPANYNQRQQYFHDRTSQQAPYKTYHDRENAILFIVEYLHLT